jgi:phage terminase Nu1 subunit (DNA packaging protein)
MNFKKAWKNNAIQFPRLLAEIRAVGLTPEQIQDLMSSMDLSKNQLAELFDRAEREFERLKNDRLPSKNGNIFGKEDERVCSSSVFKKVIVDLGWIGEGKNGDYNRDDPTDYPRLRFDVRDLTRKKRDSQDASYCTSMTTVLSLQIRQSVCRHIADAIADLPHWKRKLEEFSWINDVKARQIHKAQLEREEHGGK